MAPKNQRKFNADLLDKYSKHFNITKSGGESNDFPVLKIEEDFDDIPMTNGTCKTISTQTSPVNELNSSRNNKKGSSNSLWTSDESILRSGETHDEDTKSSSSSSACEETGGVISSGKSGKIFYSIWVQHMQSTDKCEKIPTIFQYWTVAIYNVRTHVNANRFKRLNLYYFE